MWNSANNVKCEVKDVCLAQGYSIPVLEGHDLKTSASLLIKHIRTS